MSRGVVAAGHPATAEAGAWALREGGNAVDAAVAAVLASVSTESPLTGLGAGGYMLVHEPEGESVLLDFFVAAPGHGGVERSIELAPVVIDFGDATQTFNVGAASCGVPGTPSGLAEAARRFGSMPLDQLVRPGVELARGGVEVNQEQGYLCALLAPILEREPAGAAIYAPGGSTLQPGERIVFPELADTLERLGAEGPSIFYEGDIAAAMADHVRVAGGTLAIEDLRAYETVAREPVRAAFAGHEILTNPPPSSGGILIVFALELLEQLSGSHPVDAETLVTAMEEAQAARTKGFLAGLYEDGFAERFLSPPLIAAAAERCRSLLRRPLGPDPGTALGSTTHITAMDAEGRCASVTCSNGTGSGVFVPGTGIQVNNMLGEADLNPLGFHRTPAATRMPSMMAPTVVLDHGRLELGLGSGGSNRIRSAITQTILRYLVDDLDVGEAVTASRAHFEDGIVHSEPGIDPRALARLEARGYEILRWSEPNLFFGGVHTVARGIDGSLRGAGDPRRGGAVATSEA